MARILLAEDEPLVRELAIEDLSDAGHEVVAARNGDAALVILQEDRAFDLLFTDIRMPGSIDGWQLAEEARRIVPQIKVIYSTGLNDPEQPVGSADRFILKPYRLNRLLELLKELDIG
jgi:CheY-like chemotaxis protein